MTFTIKLERLDGTPAELPSFKKDRALAKWRAR
jgi:hypothetical protein